MYLAMAFLGFQHTFLQPRTRPMNFLMREKGSWGLEGMDVVQQTIPLGHDQTLCALAH
jgi:hypothetical protein